MRTSENIDLLATALATAQAEFKDAAKSRVNPHFNRPYVTLGDVWDVIRGPMADNGLAVTQVTSHNQHGMVLNTILLHKSGQYIQGEYLINPTKTDPQGFGSAISYARRYALMAIMGVAADDDDDGNAASTPASTQQRASGFGAKPTETYTLTGKVDPNTVLVNGPNSGSGITSTGTTKLPPNTAKTWELPYTTPADFAKKMKDKLLKVPDYPSYEKLMTDNNDNIMRLLDEDVKRHDDVIVIANSRKEALEKK